MMKKILIPLFVLAFAIPSVASAAEKGQFVRKPIFGPGVKSKYFPMVATTMGPLVGWLAGQSKADGTFEIAEIDLNDDGAPEIMARYSVCTTSGCPVQAWAQGPNGWRTILQVRAKGDIVLSDQKHNGVHDLVLEGKYTWQWSGSTYLPPATRPNKKGGK